MNLRKNFSWYKEKVLPRYSYFEGRVRTIEGCLNNDDEFYELKLKKSKRIYIEYPNIVSYLKTKKNRNIKFVENDDELGSEEQNLYTEKSLGSTFSKVSEYNNNNNSLESLKDKFKLVSLNNKRYFMDKQKLNCLKNYRTNKTFHLRETEPSNISETLQSDKTLNINKKNLMNKNMNSISYSRLMQANLDEAKSKNRTALFRVRRGNLSYRGEASSLASSNLTSISILRKLDLLELH